MSRVCEVLVNCLSDARNYAFRISVYVCVFKWEGYCCGDSEYFGGVVVGGGSMGKLNPYCSDFSVGPRGVG